tara:strand:+ start:581 stop:811 length:231 start_codon:yes stop_codon:yes gene_type:complete
MTKSPFKFYITYFAKKHSAFITRKAQEPNPVGTAGKIFTDRNGVNRYIYWDTDAENKQGGFGDWRHATRTWNIKAI